MAFSDDVTLNDGSADTVYSLVSMVGGKSIRKDSDAELSAPAILTISHQVVGKGDAAVARRMVRLDKTHTDESGEFGTASAHVVLTIPNSVVTKTMVTAEVTKLIAFLEGVGNLDKLLNGEP